MLVTPDNIAQVCAQIHDARDRALDTETTGLEYSDRPFAVIIAIDGAVFYFDERACPGFWHMPCFRDLFNDDCLWHYQHAKFDMRMCEFQSGLLPRLVNDIAVQARIQRNDHIAYSLDAQASRIGKKKLGDFIKDYIAKHDLYEIRRDFFGVESKVARYDWVPLEVMQQYAEVDGILTLELAKYYDKLMDEGDRQVLAMERQLTPVLYRMETLGVRLDTKYTLEGYYHELGVVNQLKDTFAALTGQPFVDSAKSIQKVLSFDLPKTPIKFKAGGKKSGGGPSLTDDIIEDILNSDAPQADKEIVSLVREIRHYEKRISTYYVPFLNKKDGNDLIHCNMWQGGTRTGRMSSSDPNLQNVPKEDEEEDLHKPFVIRGCLVPRRGNVFVSMDYSQMEYRMMAAYAKEVSIIERVMAGEDFHKVTADLFGVSRKTAKTLNFAILYGAGEEKLANMLGVTRPEARRLKQKYFMALPNVEKFIDNVIRTGKSRGYVINWIGRKLYAEPEFCYALPNHLIQGGGADVVKLAMVRIAQEFPDIKMVLQVHDQLVFDMAPEEFVCIPRIKEIMESVWEKNGMKLTVDVSWSERSLAERDMKKGIPNAA